MTIRRAMVLAAGLGTRLRPLTLQRAKPALRLVDRAVINHVLHWLYGQGIREAVVNLHHLPESVRRAVGDGGPRDLAVSWSEEPDEVLGTGGGPRHARAFFAGEDFLLVNGDCWYGFDLGPLMADHEASEAVATLALQEHPSGGSFSGVDLDPEGRVRRIAGRPDAESHDEDWIDLHYPGVCILRPEVLDALPAEGPCGIFTDGLVPMLENGAAVHGVRCPGPWHDIGTPRRFLAAGRELLEARGGGPYLAEGATIAPEARVDAACALGEGARVEAGAVVQGSHLMEGSEVGAGAVMRDAILGYGTWLAEGERLEEGVRVEVEGRIHSGGLDPESS